MSPAPPPESSCPVAEDGELSGPGKAAEVGGSGDRGRKRVPVDRERMQPAKSIQHVTAGAARKEREVSRDAPAFPVRRPTDRERGSIRVQAAVSVKNRT